ncbi:hypothetical protein ACOMHN_054483 [Nucella lapillus]
MTDTSLEWHRVQRGSHNFECCHIQGNDNLFIVISKEIDEQLIFHCILFSLIVVGNVLVVMAIAVSPNRRSRMNIFMMNLAIADVHAEPSWLLLVAPGVVWCGVVWCSVVWCDVFW